MKKHIALFLTLALLLAMTACGAEAAPASAASAASAVSAAEESPVPAEEPPEESAEAAAGSAEESAAEEIPEEPAVVIDYPLGEGLTIDFWTEFDNNAFGSAGLTSYNELASVDDIEEATGVRYHYTEASFFSASEQFNLMIASGDWPDVLKASRYYSGGLAQAFADDIIIDLSDLLPDNAPDYYAAFLKKDRATQDNITTNGMHLQLVSMFNDYVNDGGAFVRGDWLKDLGVSFPTDFEGFRDLLYQVHDTYGCSYTYPMDPGATMAGSEAYYGSELFSLRTDSSDLALYIDEGNVVSGATSDGYRAYLEDLIDMYADGIVNGEFYVTELDRSSTMGYIGDGNIFIWNGRADSKNIPLYYTEDPDMEIVPVNTNFPGPSGEYDFMDEVLFASTNDGISITTACEDPEMVLKFYNYFFTEEGSMMTSYGIEGVTYTIENGEPKYTDLLMDNPDGMNFNMALVIYGVNGLVGITDSKARLAAYSDEVVEAINIFSNLEGTSTLHTYPNGASLTAEQATSISTKLSDVVAYATEQCLKFVIGSEPLTDESWNTYVDTCNAMGLEDCVAVYQEAYDSYMASSPE